MELWRTKESHKVGKRLESHRVKIHIPNNTLMYIVEGVHRLQDDHKVPVDATISIRTGFNVWVEAYWIKKLK